MKTKVDAEIAGLKLLKKLKGKGWKLDVWENLGWHFKVQKVVFGTWTICVGQWDSINGKLKQDYDCMIGSHGGGDGLWTRGGDSQHFNDPNVAVETEINRIAAALAPYMKLLLECQAFLLERNAK